MLKPCDGLEIELMLGPSVSVDRGQHRQNRYRRGSDGPAGVFEQGKGMGWMTGEPESSRFASTHETRRNRNRRLITVPGLMGALHTHRERLGEHEHRRREWCLRPKP